MLKSIALVVWCYWSEQWYLRLLKSSTVSIVAKWVKLGRLLYSFGEEGLGFFREVRSESIALVVWCYWSEQWYLRLLKSSTVSIVAKWVKLGRLLYSFGEEGLGFFREVRSENKLIPTVCHTIHINRPVSEVVQFPITRHSPSRWSVGP